MYEWVFEKGYASFDNQSECEDFIRWAIDEIIRLREVEQEYKNCQGNCLY
jgi:hypothetical protein